MGLQKTDLGARQTIKCFKKQPQHERQTNLKENKKKSVSIKEIFHYLKAYNLSSQVQFHFVTIYILLAKFTITTCKPHLTSLQTEGG